MMRIVPLDRHLLARLVDQERDGLTAEMSGGYAVVDRMMLASSHGLAFAMIDGADVPLGGALLPHFPGHAEACALVARTARPRHIVAGARFAKAFLDKRQRDPAFRRVQCFVRAHQPWSISFAEAMGFQREGLHRAWDALGRDYFSFARVAHYG